MSEFEITIVPAGKSDCRNIWEWRNEETARINSINSDFIPWESHQKWYTRKMDEGDMIMLILKAGEEKIGYVRFDKTSFRDAEVSISLDKSARGKGYGEKALRLACCHVFENNDINKILAYVKPENRASVKAFLKAGFIDSGEVTYKENRMHEMVLTSNP